MKGPYRKIQKGTMGRQFRNDQNKNLDDIWSDVKQTGSDIQAEAKALALESSADDGNAEAVAARTNSDGQIFDSLKDRLLDIDSYFSQLSFVFLDNIDAGLFTDSIIDSALDGGAW